MNQYNEISTLQYMGSKTRIISHICEPIIKNKSIKTVVDLFAGTGSVGYALKAHKNIISNDLEYYAYIINHAILNGCDFSVTDEISFWNAVEQQSASLQAKVCTAVTTENKFFIDTVDYKQYQLFCEKTPSVFMPQSDDPRLKEILDLVDQVTPGKAPTVETPCLFLTYYANAYFGIAQCCQIDAIRSNIGQIEDKRTRYVLLTMLMSVMSASASTTTHFAQYLKVKSKATCNNLIGKRKINIIESCKSLLAEYRQAGLCTADRKAPSVCYNLDFSDCLDSISLNNETLVYADPPYFKEHYSRYYHVLNTVCLYDYPAMAMNPQTHELSIGRYREDRSVSDFGKKAKALGAFDTLITKCSNAGAWLMISYSDNSIVDISDIQALAEKKYDVLIEKVELSHSKQGRSSISKVDEYIFICRPKKIVHDVDEKLSVIKELKPIVDNPAGFMHNYMARKPYNVVSEIIKRFCPDGGCVYDPMFGSGTTIIEASKLGRKAIGTDINLLAYKLCKASLTRWNLSKVEEVIDTFCAEVSFACESLYCFEDFNEDRILERCHFDQCGSELVPTIYWYKTRKNGKLTGRKKSVASCEFIENYRSFQTDCVQNIDNLPLIPNSRIAVKNGAAVFDYFCKRNLIAIDRIIGILHSHQSEYGYDILELLVSSAINLIKLSDKKASSQMPYWLPQKDITSRNAVMVIMKKAVAFKEGLAYLCEKCHCFIGENVVLENMPAQNISLDLLPNEAVDLILTDPPYTDQVPYLEYNQLWYKVMGWSGFTDESLGSELVVSDAPSRNKDAEDCPHCGRRLSVISESDRWTNGKPRFKYVCPGYRKKECNFKAVDGVLLDEFVVQQLSELSDENSERFRSILEIKIEEVLEQSQTVQEHNLIKKKRDKLKADIAAQTRNLREADGSIKQFIQEDLQNLVEELRETERQLSKLDEGRKNNMIAIRDLEMTKERLLSFAEYAKDAQPEVLVTLIQTIVERIYIVDKDDERYCHIFIKGCSGEDYTGFFQTAGYIEQKTTPECDSEQYCICTEISENGDIWSNQKRYWSDTSQTMRAEGY